MRRFCLTLTLCLVVAAVVVAAEEDDGIDEKHVKVLDDKNFDKQVKKDTVWLVEFYAPWCGHCKGLKPVWASAAKTLAAQNSQMKLAKVDATQNPGLTRRFSIQGYPTIKLFKDGKFRGDYSGGRSESDIIQFAKVATGAAIQNLEADDSLHGFIDQQDITFLLVGVGAGNVPTIKAFEKIAESETVFGSVAFGTFPSVTEMNVYLSEIGSSARIPGPAVVVVNTGEVSYVSSQGNNPVKLDEKNIEQFVKANQVLFFPELSPSKNWKLTKEGKKTVLAFVEPGTEAADEYKLLMKTLKKKFADKLVFGWVNAPSNTYLLDPIGLSLSSLPAFVVVDIPKMTYYKSTFATDEAEISKFLQSVLDGKVPAQPIEEKKGDSAPASAPAAQNEDNGKTASAVQAVQAEVEQLKKRIEKLESTSPSSDWQVQLSLALASIALLFSFFGKKQQATTQSSSQANADSSSKKKK